MGHNDGRMKSLNGPRPWTQMRPAKGMAEGNGTGQWLKGRVRHVTGLLGATSTNGRERRPMKHMTTTKHTCLPLEIKGFLYALWSYKRKQTKLNQVEMLGKKTGM